MGPGDAPSELAEGLWSWSCRHPEWHPGEFGAEVVSFAARSPVALLLIDPLLPADDPAAVLALLDAETEHAGRVAILITISYHVRSAESLLERYRDRYEVSIHGHPACCKRLTQATADFSAISAGEPLPGDGIPHTIGKPKRYEFPLHLRGHDAIVFGDSVVGVGGGLRVWATKPVDADVRAFYRDRFNPTLEPLVAAGAERMLMTHGASVLEGGAEALQAALAAEPWYRRG